jgi:hypothetical protein
MTARLISWGGHFSSQVDATGRLSDEGKRALLSALGEVHPARQGAAFFGAYDPTTWARGEGARSAE